jgi:hypothetical protein
MRTGKVADDFALAELQRDPREVASVFYVPLVDLQTEARWSTRSVCWRDRNVPMYYFDVRGYANAGDGERLWGLSAYAVRGLLRAMPGDCQQTWLDSSQNEQSKNRRLYE